MADYTTELRKIVAWPSFNKVLTDYPIFDEKHRPTLNTLFIERYRFRDIGYETGEMFVQRLWFKLLEIMPLYNQLYESAKDKYDPFVNVDINTTGNVTSEGTSTDKADTSGESSSKGHSESVSDQFEMPQTQLEQTGDYMTSRGVSSADTTNDATTQSAETHTGESTGKSDSMSNTSGLTGVSRSQLLLEYRSTILNIDAMIVNELGVLFMQVWRPVSRDH